MSYVITTTDFTLKTKKGESAPVVSLRLANGPRKLLLKFRVSKDAMRFIKKNDVKLIANITRVNSDMTISVPFICGNKAVPNGIACEIPSEFMKRVPRTVPFHISIRNAITGAEYHQQLFFRDPKGGKWGDDELHERVEILRTAQMPPNVAQMTAPQVDFNAFFGIVPPPPQAHGTFMMNQMIYIPQAPTQFREIQTFFQAIEMPMAMRAIGSAFAPLHFGNPPHIVPRPGPLNL